MGVPGKVIFEFDPFELTGVDKPKKRGDFSEALSEIADYVKTEILQYVGGGNSPVAGGSWKKSLSPAYKELKEKISGVKYANMELYGDMLDALEARVVGGKIQVGFWDRSQVPKAHNHNVGDTVPQRQMIPEDDQQFKSPIVKGMREIAESFSDE